MDNRLVLTSISTSKHFKDRINKFTADRNGQNIGDPTKAPSGFEGL